MNGLTSWLCTSSGCKGIWLNYSPEMHILGSSWIQNFKLIAVRYQITVNTSLPSPTTQSTSSSQERIEKRLNCLLRPAFHSTPQKRSRDQAAAWFTSRALPTWATWEETPERKTLTVPPKGPELSCGHWVKKKNLSPQNTSNPSNPHWKQTPNWCSNISSLVTARDLEQQFWSGQTETQQIWKNKLSALVLLVSLQIYALSSWGIYFYFEILWCKLLGIWLSAPSFLLRT